MKVLCIGDVFGKPGRAALRERLAAVQRAHAADLTVANCENAAGGLGCTPELAREFLGLGVDVLTSGNHIWQKREIHDTLEREERLLRPANFPPGPGRGQVVVAARNGVRVAVVNLIGRVFMPQMADDPFRAADTILEGIAREEVKVVVIDFHAETTSEKIAFARYVDGRASAVVGTHTHVQTCDEEVLAGGTARISDLGMTGPHDSVIGLKSELAIERFRTQRPVGFEVARRDVRLEGAVVDIDEATGRARSIERVRERLSEP